MKALIDTATGEVFTRGQFETDFGGSWGDLQKTQKAKWFDYPEGEVPEDCGFDISLQKLVLSPSKKAARTAKETAIANLKTRIKNYDEDTATAADRKQFLKDLKAALQELFGG